MVLVKLPPPQGGEGGTARVTAKSPTGARTLAVVRVRAQPLEMLPASRVVSSMMKRDQTPFGLKFVKAGRARRVDHEENKWGRWRRPRCCSPGARPFGRRAKPAGHQCRRPNHGKGW